MNESNPLPKVLYGNQLIHGSMVRIFILYRFDSQVVIATYLINKYF